MSGLTIYDSLKTCGFGDKRGNLINWKRHLGDVGIEIETETKVNYQPQQLTFWNWIEDHSLRDVGKEYILKAPVKRGEELQIALEEWDSKIAKHHPLIPNSYSTSVHIHLNFLNNTWKELVNFIVTYISVENILQRYAGPGRLSNLFALPICDAEGELQIILEMIKIIASQQHKKLSFLNEDNCKYSALNLCNLVKLGTMEIRSMRGLTDIKDIKDWVEILLSIKDFACKPEMTPAKIVELVDQRGAEIVYPIFGDKVDLIAKIPDKHKLIQKNLWYAAEIANKSKYDQENWGFPKPKKVMKEKLKEQLAAYSRDIYKCEYEALLPHQRIVIEEMLVRDLQLDARQVVFAQEDN